jgi:Lrp/AsnC family transcriptional regulator, regulator for asnA, asnC and gidA
LDETSRRIMSLLFKDGRSSNTLIAKKLGLSVATVARKIDSMILNQEFSIIASTNPVKMGNNAGAVIGLNLDMKKIETLFAELKKVPNIHIMVHTFGRFDLLLIAFFHDWSELHRFTRNELGKMNSIRSVSNFLISEMKMDNPVSFTKSKEYDQVSLDSLDWKIISELMQNGRPDYSELIKKLGTSKSTLFRRIASLISNNIINIVAIPSTNLENLADAFVFIDADFSKINDICTKLLSYTETHFVMTLMDGHDILVTLQSMDREDLYKFITYKLANIEGIIKYETLLGTNLLYFNHKALFRKKDLAHLGQTGFQLKDISSPSIKPVH